MLRIPLDYILQKCTLNGCEIRWGYSNSIISQADVITWAISIASEPDFNQHDHPYILQLACLLKSERCELDAILENCCKANDSNRQDTLDKWLYIILSWFYDNRTTTDELQTNVDGLYSDMEYPEVIRHLWRYTPIYVYPQGFKKGGLRAYLFQIMVNLKLLPHGINRNYFKGYERSVKKTLNQMEEKYKRP